MNHPRTLRTVAFCFALLMIPVGAAQTTNDPPIVVIEEISHVQSIGVFITWNYTGIYVDETPPEVLSWELYDGWELIDHGDITQNISQSNLNAESARKTWNWQFESQMQSSSADQPCNCYLKITAIDNAGNVGIDWHARYTGGWSGPAIGDHTPLLIIDQHSSSNIVSGDISIQGSVIDGDNASEESYEIPTIQWWISNDYAVDTNCRTWTLVQGADLPWINASDFEWGDIVTHEIPVTDGATGESMGNYTRFSATFSMTLDTRGLEDGSYQLLMRAVDNSDNPSLGFCTEIRIDNTAPIALISGPINITESSSNVQFDGSASSDTYWGRQDLTFLWILDGDPSGQIVTTGKDLRTFNVSAEKSGNYTLTLTVIDDAGFSSSTTIDFVISNVAPIAGARIDGVPLRDGDSLNLVNNQQWILDCWGSEDTTNDFDTLVCTWYLNGEAIMTGKERVLKYSDIEYMSDVYTLKLVVQDDDGATDELEITFGIQGTDSDLENKESSTGTQLLAYTIAVFAAIFGIAFTLQLIYRRVTSSAPIPKWKR